MNQALSKLGCLISELLPKLSLITSGVGVCVMTVLVMAEIIGRNIFQVGIPFSVEYTGYLVVLIGVWGAAYTLKEGRHVRADLILSRFSDRVKQWLILIGYVLGLVYLIIVTIQSFKMAIFHIKIGAVSMYPTETPVGYPQLILGIGLLMFALQLVIEIFRQARHTLNKKA